MSVTGTPREWTYEDYARLPDDGNRYEVIDGEVYMTPSPGLPHQRAIVEVFFLLRSYVMQHELGEMILDIDLLFQSGQYFRPDMLFVPRAAAEGAKDRGIYSTPGLVVEVLSKGSERIDRKIKAPRYRDFDVPEYWVVDQFKRTIERHRLDNDYVPEICAQQLSWQPDPAVPALDIDVQQIFRTP